MSAADDHALAALVASRRLAHGGGPRHSFTVEHTGARLRLRARPGQQPWEWTLVMVRGLLALSDVADIDASTRTGDGTETLELRITVDPTTLDGFEPGMLFDAAIEPDPGPGDGSLAQRQLRLRRLLARALNESLAAAPQRVELVTPAGTRVIVRSGRTDDPYAESAAPERAAAGTLIVRLTHARGISRWMEGLFSGGEGAFATIAALWTVRVPGLERRRGGARLRASPSTELIPLGRHARLWPAASARPLELVRDGVVMFPLDPALLEAGLGTMGLAGRIECPRLHLTVDESQVVRDEELTLLVAWLTDARNRGEGEPLQRVVWPTAIERVTTATGRSVEVAALLRQESRELPFVWPVQSQDLPLSARDHVLALAPSEHELLARTHPEITLVPARSITGTGTTDRFDDGAIARGSFPPLQLAVPPWRAGDEVALDIELVAYVHRHGASSRSTVVLVARDRSLGRSAEVDTALPGVTLVARLPASAAAVAVAAAPEKQRALATWVAAQALALRETIVAHVLGELRGAGADERAPLVRAAIDGLDARALELHYIAGPHGVSLAWREHPLCAVAVAHDRSGTPHSLGGALVRARDVGGVVIGEPARRWYVLEAEDPAHETWIPSERGRALLVRVLGPSALWEMPTVPQARPHVAAAADQGALLLDRDEAARLLARTSSDVYARDALLAHLLVARARGADELGLRDVPLVTSFDPEAMQPSRLVSLAALAADARPHAVVPIGTAHTGLPGPVVEAAPGLAALLHEILRLPLQPIAAPRRRAPSPSSAPRVVAKRAVGEPVLRLPITDALAAGALHLAAGERHGVDLWARGLRIGELELPSPLGDVGGRLWLSDAGVRAGRAAIEQMLLRHARALVIAARRQAELAPPGGPRRRALERFVAHCEVIAATDDRLGLRPLFPRARAPAVLSAAAATAARLPPLRRLWLGALVRHALGHAAKIETVWLSWTLAKLADPAAPVWQIELGGRHRWINRGERDESSILDVQLAALAVAAEISARAAAPSAAIAAAMLRVIATAHVGPRT